MKARRFPKSPRSVDPASLDVVVGGSACQAEAKRLCPKIPVSMFNWKAAAQCLGNKFNFPKVSAACKAEGLVSNEEYARTGGR